MTQEVKYIHIRDLVLWTENPRDPIDPNAKDQDIVDKALDDEQSKWNLDKLAREMGNYYDFSELPTVVYENEKPVVYDGNRRIVLGKIKLGLVKVPETYSVRIPEFPESIPCNVCDKNTALNNVLRKHSDSGSWQPLERDTFLYKFMNREKSVFLTLEEDTGIISINPHLNQRFVKEEIFSEDNLRILGFTIQDNRLNSIHSDDESANILRDVSQKVADKTITTRKNRGKIKEVLDPLSQQTIDQNRGKATHPTNISFIRKGYKNPKQRQARRTGKKENQLFGEKLYLRIGEVSDIYRDISDLYQFYLDNRLKLSQSFPALFRMSLRLLCEAAAKEQRQSLEKYVKDHFDQAKAPLSQDIKTTLSNQNVSKESIVQLLHTGAHNYQSSNNLDQTIALSIIVGSIITITHGQE